MILVHGNEADVVVLFVYYLRSMLQSLKNIKLLATRLLPVECYDKKWLS